MSNKQKAKEVETRGKQKRGRLLFCGSNGTNLLSALPYYNRREGMQIEYGHKA